MKPGLKTIATIAIVALVTLILSLTAFVMPNNYGEILGGLILIAGLLFGIAVVGHVTDSGSGSL